MSDCLFGVLLDLVVLVVLARGLHPVSFPNLEVKPFCADGTATGGLWESRALPTVSFWWWGCLVLFVGVGAPTTLFLFVVSKIGHCRGCVRFSNTPPTFMFCLWCVLGVGAPPFMRLGDRHRCLRSSQYINLTLSA